MFAKRFTLAWLWSVSVAGIVAAPGSAAGQTHVLSVYRDADADESTLYGYVSGIDESTDTECFHDHFTGGRLIGPTGVANASVVGVDAVVTIAFAEGDFNFGAWHNLSCGCGSGSHSASGEDTISFPVTWYGNPVESTGLGCIYEALACTSGSPTCDERPLLVSGAPTPCALTRRSTYIKVGGVGCRGIFSSGHNAVLDRVCT